MIPSLLIGLGWLVGCLALFILIQRWLHWEIQAVFLLLTQRPSLTKALFSLLFFPGVLLHELSHYIMARLLGVHTEKISLLPKTLPGGKLQLGYVETSQTGVGQDALIGLAPLLTGGIAISILGIGELGMLPMIGFARLGYWDQAFQAAFTLPSQPDFWLWFYFAFTISSTMLPSASDRRAWLPIILGFVLLLALALLAGAGPWMVETLGPGMDEVLRAMAAVFAISLLMHAILLVPTLLIRLLLNRLTGMQVR